MILQSRSITEFGPTEWKDWSHECGELEYESVEVKDHYLCFYHHLRCKKCKKTLLVKCSKDGIPTKDRTDNWDLVRIK